MLTYSSRNWGFACIIIVLVRASTITGSIDCDNLNTFVYIKSQKSGLVLDGKSTFVTVETINKSGMQQWQFHPSSRIGLFNIINRSTGKAIDVTREQNVGRGYYLTLAVISDSIYQQWFVNSNGTLVNGGLQNHVMDIYAYNYTGGARVQAFPYRWNIEHDNQLFTLDYVM